jgi:hypothetical protein
MRGSERLDEDGGILASISVVLCTAKTLEFFQIIFLNGTIIDNPPEGVPLPVRAGRGPRKNLMES